MDATGPASGSYNDSAPSVRGAASYDVCTSTGVPADRRTVTTASSSRRSKPRGRRHPRGTRPGDGSVTSPGAGAIGDENDVAGGVLDEDDGMDADLRELRLTSAAISAKASALREFNDSAPFGTDFHAFLGTESPPEIEDLLNDTTPDAANNRTDLRSPVADSTDTIINKFAWMSYIAPKDGPGLIVENTPFYHIQREQRRRKRRHAAAKRHARGPHATHSTETGSAGFTSTSRTPRMNVSIDEIDRRFEESMRNDVKRTSVEAVQADTPASTSVTTTPIGPSTVISPTSGVSGTRRRKVLPTIPTEAVVPATPIDTVEDSKKSTNDIVPSEDPGLGAMDIGDTAPSHSAFSGSAFDISSHGSMKGTSGRKGVENTQISSFYGTDEGNDHMSRIGEWVAGVIKSAPTNAAYSEGRIAEVMKESRNTVANSPVSASVNSPYAPSAANISIKSGSVLPQYSPAALPVDSSSMISTGVRSTEKHGKNALIEEEEKAPAYHEGLEETKYEDGHSNDGSIEFSDDDDVRRRPIATKSQKMNAIQSIFSEKQKIAYVGLCYLSIMRVREERLSKDNKLIKRSLASFDRWAKRFMEIIYIYLDISPEEQAMITNLAQHGLNPQDLAGPIIMEVQHNGELLEQRQIEQQKREQELLDAGLPLIDTQDTSGANKDGELTDVRYTILTHLFIISISEGRYDSRSRAILKQVGLYLDVPVLDILRLEATVSEQLRMYDDSQDPTKDQVVVERRNKSDVRRRWIATGIAALAGGAVIGLTAGLAAPLIAGGIGVALTTLGVSGATGIITSTGAVALITTGGILTGGGMGGVKMLKRTKGVEEFEFLNVAEAKINIRQRKEKFKNSIYKKRRREAREALVKRLQRNNSPFVHNPLRGEPDVLLFDVFSEFPDIAKELNEENPPLIAALTLDEKLRKATGNNGSLWALALRRQSQQSSGKLGKNRDAGSAAVTSPGGASDQALSPTSTETPKSPREYPSTEDLPQDILNPFAASQTSVNRDAIAIPDKSVAVSQEINPYSPTSGENTSTTSLRKDDNVSVSASQSTARTKPPIPNRPDVILPREILPRTSIRKRSLRANTATGHKPTSGSGAAGQSNDQKRAVAKNADGVDDDAQPAHENKAIPEYVFDEGRAIDGAEAAHLLDDLQSTVAGETVAGDEPGHEDGMIFKDDEEERPRQPSVMITVAGWLTYGNDDFVLPFSTLEEGIYGEHYTLVWESKVLLDLGSALKLLVSEIASFIFQQGLQATVLSTLMIGLAGPLWTMKLSYLIDNPWGIGISKATKVGKVLADFLIQGVQEDRPVTLVGYSLGARVLYHCLLELADRGAYGLIEEVYLFGCPVMASKKEWLALSSVVSGRVVNGYCEQDMVLGVLFRASTAVWSDVAGLRPIKDVPGVENINLSEIVKGHLDYRMLLPQVLKLSGFSVTSDEFSDAEVE